MGLGSYDLEAGKSQDLICHLQVGVIQFEFESLGIRATNHVSLSPKAGESGLGEGEDDGIISSPSPKLKAQELRAPLSEGLTQGVNSSFVNLYVLLTSSYDWMMPTPHW